MEDVRRATPTGFGGGSGRVAFPGCEDDAAAVITQLERDEAMARALAEEDGVLARQLQVQCWPSFDAIASAIAKP